MTERRSPKSRNKRKRRGDETPAPVTQPRTCTRLYGPRAQESTMPRVPVDTSPSAALYATLKKLGCVPCAACGGSYRVPDHPTHRPLFDEAVPPLDVQAWEAATRTEFPLDRVAETLEEHDQAQLDAGTDEVTR